MNNSAREERTRTKMRARKPHADTTIVVYIHHMGSRKRLQAFLWSFISSFALASEDESLRPFFFDEEKKIAALGFEHRIAL